MTRRSDKVADVKWIKITTNMFEDEKIDFIESLPEADAILIIWIKLLTLAGKCNAGGYILLTENIPYTEEMLAHKFRRPLNTVKLAFNTFKKLEMITIDNNAIYLPNWEKHQNVDGLEKIRKQTRLRVEKYREKQKLLLGNVTSNVTVTQGNAIDIDKDIDIDIEYNNILPNGSTSEQSPDPVKEIISFYNLHRNRMPEAKTLSKARKGYIHARLDNYGIDAVKEVILKAESSNFLNGCGSKGWIAPGIDWLMRPENFPKVLEGKYDNQSPRGTPPKGTVILE